MAANHQGLGKGLNLCYNFVEVFSNSLSILSSSVKAGNRLKNASIHIAAERRSVTWNGYCAKV